MNAPFLRQNSRHTNSSRKQRIDALSVLPVFFDLNGKNVVVIGGTDAAAWKAELLGAAGANVLVHAVCLTADFKTLIAGSPHSFQHRQQQNLATDIADATLVICDAPTQTAAQLIRNIAKLHGVPVNVIDQPKFCDFQFGSIVNRSPAVIAISTNGAAPIFGQAIRRRIEMVLPAQIAHWANLAENMRDRINQLLAPGRERRTFWETFVDKAFGEEVSPDCETALLDDCRQIAKNHIAQTKITHIGYCANDPELIIIKSMRALQSADVIIHSPTTPREILELARREAKRICVDNPAYANTPLGAHTVRLIEGNPCLFDQTEVGAPNITSCAPETA